MSIRRLLPGWIVCAASAVALLTACGGDAATSDTAAVAESGFAAGTAAAASEAGTGVTDIRDYELRMEQVDKYYAASRNITSAMQRMTREQRAQVDVDAGHADLDGYIARLENEPAINEAIRNAGLTAREFSLILWSMLQSGMASAVFEAQPDVNQDSVARAMNVNMANVRFVREHQADLQRKQDSLDAELEASADTGQRDSH